MSADDQEGYTLFFPYVVDRELMKPEAQLVCEQYQLFGEFCRDENQVRGVLCMKQAKKRMGGSRKKGLEAGVREPHALHQDLGCRLFLGGCHCTATDIGSISAH